SWAILRSLVDFFCKNKREACTPTCGRNASTAKSTEANILNLSNIHSLTGKVFGLPKIPSGNTIAILPSSFRKLQQASINNTSGAFEYLDNSYLTAISSSTFTLAPNGGLVNMISNLPLALLP